MGRKRGIRKPQRKNKPKAKLETIFDCPFCYSIASVTCKLEKRKTGLGRLYCLDCNARFVTSVGSLDEPIDVYAKWIDACETQSCESSGVASRENVSKSGIGHETDHEVGSSS